MNSRMGGASAELNGKIAKRRKLTPEESADAARLRALYEAKKKPLRLTQESLATLMGFQTQGAVSQYMLGRVPMNNEVVVRFAYHLEADPREIRPDIFEKIPMREIVEVGSDDQDAFTWGRRFAKLRDEDRKILADLLDMMEQKSRPGE